jgi:hypothetical protein
MKLSRSTVTLLSAGSAAFLLGTGVTLHHHSNYKASLEREITVEQLHGGYKEGFEKIQRMNLLQFSLVAERVQEVGVKTRIDQAILERESFIEKEILKGKKDRKFFYILSKEEQETLKRYDEMFVAPLFEKTDPTLPPIEKETQPELKLVSSYTHLPILPPSKDLRLISP